MASKGLNLSRVPEHGYYTRSKNSVYRAAGVLPFATMPHGEVLLLLGREMCFRSRTYLHLWKDFGGQREAIDLDAETTASREFSEETLGLFGGCDLNDSSVSASCAFMTNHLRSSDSVFRVCSPLKKRGYYCMFVSQVSYLDPFMFQIALQENKSKRHGIVGGSEKNGFVWINASKLISAVKSREGHVRVECEKKFKVTLHPCFVSTLKLALKNGLAKFLKAFSTTNNENLLAKNKKTVSSLRKSSQSKLLLSSRHMLYWLIHLRENIQNEKEYENQMDTQKQSFISSANHLNESKDEKGEESSPSSSSLPSLPSS